MKIVRHLHSSPGPQPALAAIVIDQPMFNRDRPKGPEEELIFQMDTYKKLSGMGTEANWHAQFLAINNFLATLEQSDVYLVHDFFLRCKRILNSVTETTYRDAVTKIAAEIINLSHDTKLLPRFLDYVRDANLPIPQSVRNITLRPQDSAEMTFRYPEYVQLTAISLLAKLISPIWGEFIARVEGFIDNVNKETFCLAMLEPLLESGYGGLTEVYEKLSFYLGRVVTSETNRLQGGAANKNEVKFVQAFGGFSDVRLNKTIYSIIFVKKFANVDLLEPKCDLMKYINVSINATFRARLSSLRRSNTQARTEPPAGEGDRDNASYLEHDTQPSSSTADVPILIRKAAEMAIPGLLRQYTIPKPAYDDAVRHFQRYLVTPTPFNRAVLSMLFSDAIGGSYSLRYLNLDIYTRLVAVAQLILAQRDQRQLVHLLSATTPQAPKEEAATSIDYSITTNLTISSSYRQLERLYTIKVDGKDIQTHLRGLMDWVVNYHHYYNTPPSVVNLLDEDQPPVNGELVVYDERVMLDICDFMIAVRSQSEV